MSHVTAKSSPNDAVPSGLIHYVKLGLDNLCDFVEHLLLLECVVAAIHSVLLHSLRHVGVLDDGEVDILLLFLLQLFGINSFPVGVLRRFAHSSKIKFKNEFCNPNIIFV